MNTIFSIVAHKSPARSSERSYQPGKAASGETTRRENDDGFKAPAAQPPAWREFARLAISALTAACTFSNARTSICRTRSRDTPNSVGKFLERDRIVDQPARFENAPLARIQHAQRAPAGRRDACPPPRDRRARLPGWRLSSTSQSCHSPSPSSRNGAFSEASPPSRRFMSMTSCLATPSFWRSSSPGRRADRPRPAPKCGSSPCAD